MGSILNTNFKGCDCAGANRCKPMQFHLICIPYLYIRSFSALEIDSPECLGCNCLVFIRKRNHVSHRTFHIDGRSLSLVSETPKLWSVHGYELRLEIGAGDPINPINFDNWANCLVNVNMALLVLLVYLSVLHILLLENDQFPPNGNLQACRQGSPRVAKVQRGP